MADVVQRGDQWLSSSWPERVMNDTTPIAHFPIWARKLPRGVQILRTNEAIFREGREMNNYAGEYAMVAHLHLCHILSIRTRQGRSTALLWSDMSVAEHCGHSGSPPPPRNEKLLQALLKRKTFKAWVKRKTFKAWLRGKRLWRGLRAS